MEELSQIDRSTVARSLLKKSRYSKIFGYGRNNRGSCQSRRNDFL